MATLEIEFSPLEEFDFWLSEMEVKAAALATKPTSKDHAKTMLEKAKKLKGELDERPLPEDLTDFAAVEADPKLEGLLERRANLRSSLMDSANKTEALCECWNKLNHDVKDLTSALSSGGSTKMTLEKLEESLAEIKAMFRERAGIMDNLVVTAPAAEDI